MAAIKLFELGFILKAIDRMSGPLRAVKTQIEGLNGAMKQTAPMREAAGTLAMVGIGSIAAGGAIVYGLKSFIGPAIEAQGQLANLATAMDNQGEAAKNLVPANEFLTKVAQTHVESLHSLRDAYYDLRSTNLNNMQALAGVASATNLVTATAKTADDAQANMAPTARLLGTMFQNFGDKTKAAIPQMNAFADQLALMQSSQAFHTIGEVTDALSYAAPMAKVAHVSITDMNTALSLLSAGGKHGAEAGTGFEEMMLALISHKEALPFIKQTANGMIDLGGTIQNIANATKGMSGVQESAWLKSIGLRERAMQGIGILIDKTNEFRGVHERLDKSQGAAAQLAAVRQAAADFQLGLLIQNWGILKEAIGENLLPVVNDWLPRLTAHLQNATDWVKQHQEWVGWGLKIAAVGSAILIVGGALSLAASALLGFVSAWGAISKIPGIIMSLFTPIGLVLGAIALLAFGAYEIYKHWDGIKVFFLGIAHWIEAIDWKATGIRIITSIADGIWSVASLPGKAMESVVGKLRSYLPFSPAKEGPLRDLNRVRIVETIAETMKPAPMIEAMRRVALAGALAIPMTLAVQPAMAAIPSMMTRELPPITTVTIPSSRASNEASSRAAASNRYDRAGGTATVTINLKVQIIGTAGADDFGRNIEKHGRELAAVLKRELERQSRADF
jgi:TP901 family phage tail tape measure protein